MPPSEPTLPDPSVARLLGDAAVWAEVPDGLRARTVAAAATGGTAPSGRGRSRPAGRAWRRPGLAAAAAAVLVAGLVATGARPWTGPGPEGVEVALAGTVGAPG